MPALAAVTASSLSLDAHVAAVSSPRHGAVATFVGMVRDHDPSVVGEVTHLEYSAHPDAEAVLARIVAEVEDAYGAVLAVTHRVGLLGVGDVAIVGAAGAGHRAQAFEACREAVERVKAEVPIWKREILADGSHTWVGLR
ncbi:molybdenum cofactor biosynthesis protein MoaE [Demequina sp. SYSU T00039]|uniref:Molybdenum cofactor biosynthesis protein MoaE n=1 Tax=Demequina lignilytica TaxID=3051663 RepID=A0AAW7M8A7_9MICO|nr:MULTISPECIES: molybdenum cofactor biosynthesis protein MoaE [unclassified Demequina]MDN4478436.1 molybdenum cofactor biosynthesis protein MoaE [Demequina sp. SYSU T00039-1]MDN4487057.1 molybdenum cofactor biosynthesis protein MoaE [Demequina sp. SYSU T00039]MDN4489768.1 molybdenum cofactor biosynthesis protein MoaE [Demequina sp. SYSU T00068]